MSEWFVKTTDGKEKGPISEGELFDRWEQGKIGFSAKVRKSGDDEWRSLSDVVEDLGLSDSAKEENENKNLELSDSNETDSDGDSSSVDW